MHVRDRPDAYGALLDALVWFYPSLKGQVRVTSTWEGVIAANLCDYPCVGRDGPLLHALAFCGHGVSVANLSGELVRELFLDAVRNDASASAMYRQRNHIGCLVREADKAQGQVKVATARDAALRLHFVGTRLFPPVPGEPVRKLVASSYLGVLRGWDFVNDALARGRNVAAALHLSSMLVLPAALALLVGLAVRLW